MKRDLSQQQFEDRATKLGFQKGGFMGYWRMASDPALHVSAWNAGSRRRAQLRYLIREDKKAAARKASSVGHGNEEQRAHPVSKDHPPL